MVFIGMDHGTTGISFCIMSDDGDIIDIFKIGREESKKGLVSASEELTKRIDLNSVKLMAITYAMGDGISDIVRISWIGSQLWHSSDRNAFAESQTNESQPQNCGYRITG